MKHRLSAAFTRLSIAVHAATTLAAATLLLVACADSDTTAPGAPPATGSARGAPAGERGARAARGPSAPVPVVVASAIERTVTTPIEAVGTAMSRVSVDVTSKVSNTVARIAFQEGQRVERGAVLVELDPTEVAADLAGAEARLAEARRQVGRSRDLAAQNVLSAAQLDQLEAALQSAEAEAAAARARRANSVIRAPFAGRTGFRRVSVGGLVSPGTVITTLDDSSIIKLEFSIPEAQLYLIEPGLAISARAAGLPGRSFSGQVTTLDARVDPVSRSLRVRAELPNPDGELRPGMFMSVDLEGRPTQAVVVPEAAIVPEQGKTFVYLVEAPSTVRRREVQIGRRTRGQVEIANGLSAGDRVIVEGTQLIRDGAQVDVVRAASPAAAEPVPAPVGRVEGAGARADR